VALDTDPLARECRAIEPRRDNMFSSAEAYDRHVGRYGPALSRAHIAAADVKLGDVVLDVGCGPGALTSALAALVGADQVAAVDPSQAFVETCRARVPGADVRVGSAEDLPELGRSFDVAMSQLVLNFMQDAEAGVSAMRDATRAGGTVTSSVWDYAGEMTLLRAFWDAARELDPDAPDEGLTMRYCSPGELEELWRTVGLEGVSSSALVVEADYADFDDLWAPFPTGLGPSGAYCASLDPDRQQALRDAYHRRLGSPSGAFTLTARAWFVRGTTRAQT
jgi:SAM-dependent methyltransferase